ncbi:TPM domain-containing protein [Sphingomonas sp. ID0503]|uniref:TPM domain-containing protein n=1 Tax=Sphingomonas sp. ID0503 TaxID=3399691 RepID=UPI003AFA8329
MLTLTPEDHAKVTAAVAAAEAETDGEIVTIVARQSDSYHDVALHWAVGVMLLVLAVLSVWPEVALWLHHRLFANWTEQVPPAEMFAIALLLLALTFLVVRAILAWTPLRMALTPGVTKSRRVRRRAVDLFMVGAHNKTRARTGVLLYLSMAEHRAEIVADEAIASRVAPEAWGEAMAALIADVKDRRPGDGMAAAVQRIGAILASHFSRSADDTNELCDRVIEL